MLQLGHDDRLPITPPVDRYGAPDAPPSCCGTRATCDRESDRTADGTRRATSPASAAPENPNVVVRSAGSLEVLGGSERPTVIEQFIAHVV